MEAESKESSEISRTRKSRIRQSWSVAAATYVGCCFTEMESDRSLRRRLDRGTGSLSSGAVASGAMVPAGGATAAAPAPGFTGRCLRALSWMGLPWVCQRNSVARHAEPAAVENCPPPVLYTQRWVQLAFLALLALVSDLVCFSVAATPATWTKVFGQDPASLIDIFLFTNVFACFLEPYVIRKFGLRIPIVGAAVLMAVGCWLRSGIPFSGEELPGYSTVVAGTMLVAVAQPFFQCTPPLLSATWFAPDERALSTAVAINFNQVGIATAFVAGGAFGGSEAGLKAFGPFGMRKSASELEKMLAAKQSGTLKSKDAKEKKKDVPADTFLREARRLVATPGFIPPLAAFVTSIAVTNVVGAFMDLVRAPPKSSVLGQTNEGLKRKPRQKLQRAGFNDQMEVDLAGAGFEIAIVCGAQASVTLWCLGATLLGVLLLGMESMPRSLALVALLAIGSFAGPVQPINAELAVEVTYPCDENAIEAVQQLCGNLVSALLVPICEWAAENKVTVPGFSGYLRGDTLLLLAILVVVSVYFSTFSAPLRRTEVDSANCLTEEATEEARLQGERIYVGAKPWQHLAFQAIPLQETRPDKRFRGRGSECRSAFDPEPLAVSPQDLRILSPEHGRLSACEDGVDWKKWGPYVSERHWGTCREDYAPHGNSWIYLPFEAAHFVAYRWGEDGLAGWCDKSMSLCLGLALWNGKDAILKESGSMVSPIPRATTARMSRSCTTTWTPRPLTAT
ncbi:unnamed protein product [Effrenium voratum]|nr:unnamed protein product [Effrenium voratum]